MENVTKKREGFLGGMAKVLNAGGSAVLYTYDASVNLLGKSYSLTKKSFSLTMSAAGSLPAKTKGMIPSSVKFGITKPGDRKKIEAKIREYEEKINSVYAEIGKEGAGAEDLESDNVRKLINDAKEYEKEVERLKNRLTEIDEAGVLGKPAVEKGKGLKDFKLLKKNPASLAKDAPSYVKSAIDKAVMQGTFETESDRAIFEKISYDLLDDELEIKILAASELGKTGNKAAVPVLMETVRFGNPYLMSEIVNSLIRLEDTECVSLLKQMTGYESYKVRLGVMRGLYKLAGDDDVVPVLLALLKDEHPEVRKNAATYLGWKDQGDAVPALVQTLQDKEEKVRKAAVSSLANIKDKSAVLPLMRMLGDGSMEIREKSLDAIKTITEEEINIDLDLTGKAMSEAINGLKQWWQDERIKKVELTLTDSQSAMPGDAAGEENALHSTSDTDLPEEDDPFASPSSDEDFLKPSFDSVPDQEAESDDFASDPSGADETSEEIPTEDDSEEIALPERSDEGEEERETLEETDSDTPGFSFSQLRNKTKSELIALAGEGGVEVDESFTKADIIKKIMGTE